MKELINKKAEELARIIEYEGIDGLARHVIAKEIKARIDEYEIRCSKCDKLLKGYSQKRQRHTLKGLISVEPHICNNTSLSKQDQSIEAQNRG